ncbi:MAG: hypothetical protein J5J04_06020 [Anaerolineae bacterium]|nr:hypothetical protein [Anaerolineae bacterium]
MAIVAQLAPAWDGSSRAQLASAWADDALSGIVVWDDFDRSSVDASLSTVGIDTDDVELVTLRCRMQYCNSIGSAPRWLEPFAKVTGVQGLRPRFVFEPYASTGGDNRNTQTWLSTQYPHFSYDGINWQPFGGKSYTTRLSARHTTAFTEDTVYVARSWPRPLTVIGNQVAALAAAHPDKIAPTPTALAFTPTLTTGFPAQAFIADECAAAVDERGRAVPPTPIYAFEINDTAFPGPKKDAHIISAVHSGEDVGEVVFWEMLDFILNSSATDAVAIRQQYRIFVYPCANPVGKYAGYWRGTPGSSEDPNRNWNNPTPPFDSITKMRNMVLADHAGRRLWWCFNVHATAWDEQFQLGATLAYPASMEFDRLSRGRYPGGQWGYYYDINTPAGSELPGTCSQWQKEAFSPTPVLQMLTETCDRPGPISPAVMRPYAEAMVGALADMDAAGWFDDAPTGTLTLGTPSVTASSISLPWTYSAADHDGIEYRYRLTAGTWSAWIDAGLTSPIEITGLTSSAEYEIEAQAYNVAGAGTPQTVTVTVGAVSDLTPQDASHAHAADNLTLSVGLSLAVQDAAHAHTADNLTANTGLSLAVQSASHDHMADAAVLAAALTLAVQDALHSHTADATTLSAALTLAVQSASHAHTTDNLTATTGLSIAVQDALHAHAADNLTATTDLSLAVQSASHTHTTDAATLSAALTLAVQDALHAHAADAPTLSASTPDSLTLSVADATHAHLADALALAGSHTLVVQSATHSHAVEALTLSAVLNLLVDNALHAQLADNVALSDSTAANLVAQNASHSHLAEALTLSGALALIVQDAQHAHLSEQATLSAAHSLVVQNAAHAHLADAVDASSGLALSIANAFHTHLADNVDADTALSLAIHDALHAHQAEAATLTAALTLIVSDAIHTHFADQAEFFIPVPLVDQLRRSVFLRIAQQRPFVRVDEQRVFIRVQ